MNTEPAEVPSTESLKPSKPRRRWLALLLAVLIFTGGFVCGGGVVTIVAVHRLQYAIHHPEEAPARIAATLKRRLRLDNDQTTKIEAIIGKRQVALMTIREHFQPQISKQLDEIRNEIGQVLNDSQRTQWTTMFDDLREHWLPPIPPAAEKKAA